MEDGPHQEMNVEQGLQRTGSPGPYQVLVFTFLFIPGLFHIARMTSVDFAVQFKPKYRCAIPGSTNDSYAKGDYQHQVDVNETIPEDKSCQVYNVSRSFQYDRYHRPINATSPEDFQSCPNGFVYDQSVIRNTDVMKMNLVCDKEDLTQYVDMGVMFGSIVGAIVFGAISDRYGRKIGFVCSVPVSVGAGMGITWAPDYISLCILFAVAGAGCTGMFTCAFVLGLESVEPIHRNIPGLLMQIFLPLGQILMAGVGYGVRDWRWINVAISAPPVLFILYYWFLPESPLWLNTNGKMAELLRIFVKMARINRRLGILTEEEMRDELEGLIEDVNADERAPRDSIFDMFRSRVLCVRSLVTFLNWFAANYCYYGLILFTANLSGNLYATFALAALVEIPAHVISLLLVNRIGRKSVHCSYYLIVVVTMAACTGMKAGNVGYDDTVVLALTLIGKFGAAGLIGTSFLWMVELYPVSVRSTGAGLMALAAKIGAIVSPLVIEKASTMTTPFGNALPYIGFGGFALVAFVACMILPETRNKTLPTTVAEAREFGRANRLVNADNPPQDYGAVQR